MFSTCTGSMLEHWMLQEDGTNVAMTNDTRNNYIDILRYYFIAIYQCFISIAASKIVDSYIFLL